MLSRPLLLKRESLTQNAKKKIGDFSSKTSKNCKQKLKTLDDCTTGAFIGEIGISFPNIFNDVKIEISRANMVVRSQFQRKRDRNRETRDQTTALEAIRAALQKQQM